MQDIYKVQNATMKKTTISFQLSNNVQQNYVLIPLLANLVRYRRNEKEYKWLDNIMDTLKMDLSSTNNRNNSCYNLLCYIGLKDIYKLVFEKAAKSFGLTKLPKW